MMIGWCQIEVPGLERHPVRSNFTGKGSVPLKNFDNVLRAGIPREMLHDKKRGVHLAPQSPKHAFDRGNAACRGADYNYISHKGSINL
jgi:hypothetical protein